MHEFHEEPRRITYCRPEAEAGGDLALLWWKISEPSQAIDRSIDHSF
jgi:hypothetical protein